jgi:hypothetical protein
MFHVESGAMQEGSTAQLAFNFLRNPPFIAKGKGARKNARLAELY